MSSGQRGTELQTYNCRSFAGWLRRSKFAPAREKKLASLRSNEAFFHTLLNSNRNVTLSPESASKLAGNELLGSR
jgi:hypothetical protein